MTLKFGTSGVRGLVTEMTDLECFLYTKAYAEYLKKTDADTVCLAGDFRSSTPRIMKAVGYALVKSGLNIDNAGFVPTPTLAFHSMAKKAGAIMVTGSHIPDDRNGIKFYMAEGETLKPDEQAISAIYARMCEDTILENFNEKGMLKTDVDLGPVNETVRANYIQRYLDFFPAGCLAGLHLVFYQHSSVGRTVFPEILEKLGARVTLVGFSNSFVPVDTEAVANPEKLAEWVTTHKADALVSADGDCDRPLLVCEDGKVIRGDVLGILAGSFLGADSVSTPVSCNTALELCGRFSNIDRTKIGSPFVIASMIEAEKAGRKVVVGYEANGGFLTGSDMRISGCEGVLTALPTRDAVLPVLSALVGAKKAGKKLSELVNELPPRYTISGIIREFPTEIGQKIVQAFVDGGVAKANELLSDAFGTCEKIDMTDGARMTFSDGGVLHFRPSGNAPEFRIYTEYSTEQEAIEKNDLAKKLIAEEIKPKFA